MKKPLRLGETEKNKFLVLFILALIFLGVSSTGFAAEAGEAHESIAQTIGKWINFIALVAILYYLLIRKFRVQDKFKEESDQIQLSIESARKAKEEAEKRLHELDAKMADLSTEVERIKAAAAREAEEERKRILESAQKEAERIVESAQREMDSEVRIARKNLRKRIADLAVEQGKKIVEREMNQDDHKRLIEDYIKEFGK